MESLAKKKINFFYKVIKQKYKIKILTFIFYKKNVLSSLKREILCSLKKKTIMFS